MPDNIISYSVDGRVADVPEDKTKDFLAKYPKAVQVKSFTVNRGGKVDTADVPLDKVDAFTSKYPQAKPLHDNKEEYDDPQEFHNILNNAVMFGQVKQLKDQVNTGTETEDLKKKKEESDSQKYEYLVGSAYNSKMGQDHFKVNAPTELLKEKEAPDTYAESLNDDGTLTYVEGKTQGKDGVFRPIRKTLDAATTKKYLQALSDKKQIVTESTATPTEKAAWGVYHYFSNTLPVLGSGLKEIGKDISEGVAASSGQKVEDSRNWKDRTLDGLTGTMQVVGSVAKVAPASAGAVGLWTGATNAAQMSVERFKDDSSFNAEAIYHTVHLLTEPATEIRSYITKAPMTEREQKFYSLADNLAFLGEAYMLDKGIGKVLPDEKYISPEKREAVKTAVKDSYGIPEVAQYNVEKNAKIADIVNNLKKRTSDNPYGAKLSLDDLPILHDIVNNSSDEDIAAANKKSNDKLNIEQQKRIDALKERESKPKGDEAPDDVYQNLTKGQVKKYKTQNYSESIIDEIDKKIGKQKIDEAVKNYATDFEKTETPKEEGKNDIEEPKEETSVKNIDKIKTGEPFESKTYRGEGKDKNEIYTDKDGIAVAGKGIYHALEKGDAENYGNVSESKVELKNPLVIKNDTEWKELTKEAGWKYPNIIGLGKDVKSENTEALKQLILDKGHDGLVIKVPKSELEGKTLQRVFAHNTIVDYNTKNTLGITKEGISAAEPRVSPLVAVNERINDIKESDLTPEEKEVSIKKLQDKIDAIKPESAKVEETTEKPIEKKEASIDDAKSVVNDSKTLKEAYDKVKKLNVKDNGVGKSWASPEAFRSFFDKTKKEAKELDLGNVTQLGVSLGKVGGIINHVRNGVVKDFESFKKGIKEAKAILPENTDNKIFVKTAYDMAKALYKEHTLKGFFYDKSNAKITDPVNLKPLLDSQKNIQGTVQYAVKNFGTDPEAFKNHLEQEAILHGSLAEASEDPNIKLQSEHTFNSLSTINDMVRKGDEGKDDIRWVNKILDGQNKVDINGELKTAWTIEQAKLLEELGRPDQPITPEEYNAVDAALHPYESAIDRPVTGTDIGEELGQGGIIANKAIGDADEYLKKGLDFVRYPQFYHRLGSSPVTRALMKDMYSSYLSELNGGYQERATQLERSLNPDAINRNWTKEEQDKVSKVMDEGFYNERKTYNTDELKEKGLSDKEIGLYNHYQDVLKQTKEWFKDGYKAQVNFDKLDPNEQKSVEDKFPEWLKNDNGYQHLKRKGDYYIAYHGLNDVTNTEVPQVEFFETQKKANERAKELNSQTYDVNGEQKKYAGLTHTGVDENGFKQYERKEGMMPEVNKKKEFDFGLAKAVGYDDPDFLYDLAGQIGLNNNSEEWKSLNSYIENLKKKQGYIPSLSFHSNRIPGAPLDFQSKIQSLRDLGEQAAHYRQRRTSGNIWDDRMRDLQDVKNQKDQRAVNLYNSWKDDMTRQSANTKYLYLFSKLAAANYLYGKPMMIMEQYAKNALTMPPELIDRFQKAGMPAGKSDLLTTKIMAKSWIEGHGFGFSKIYPKGVDEFGNKVVRDKFVPKDEKSQQRFRLMNRGFDRGGISNMALDLVSDNDGTLSSKNTARRGWVMGHAPLLTRSMAFNAGLHAGQELGIKDDDALLKYAENYLYDTKYRYGKENRPQLLQNKNALARLFTPFLNTHALYLQWFSQDLGNLHKSFYKVAPRLALGGATAGVPIAGTILANMMNAWYTAQKNASVDPDKRTNVVENIFSRDATDAYKAQIESANMPKFMKDMIINGSVDATANSAGVSGGINTSALVGLGKEYFQDYFTLPNITGFYSNPVMKTGKALKDLGSTAGDLLQGHFYDSKYDFLQFLKDNPQSELHNIGESADWYQNGHKLSGQVDYVPSVNETIQTVLGGQTDRLKAYQSAMEASKNYSGQRKEIIDQSYTKLNEALNKRDFSKIIAYYNNPSRQNAETLYGKDYIENVFKFRNGLKNTVGTLFKNSELANDGKINDLGNWQKMDISVDHQDSYQTNKHNSKYSLQSAISTWLKNSVSKKELKEHPELQQFYNSIFGTSIDRGSMKSAGQLIQGK